MPLPPCRLSPSSLPASSCAADLPQCTNKPWKKAQIGHGIAWYGWSFDFSTETIHLAQSKLDKLRLQLQHLLQGRNMQRKKLEATLGLLMWATNTCPRIRPYLAPLYRDLGSAAGTFKLEYLIHPQFWQSLLDSLGDSAKVIANPPGLWLPVKATAKVIFAGNAPVRLDVKTRPSQSHSSGQRYLDTRSRPVETRGSPWHRKQIRSALATAMLCT